jgi:hypothetical protein
MSFTKCFDVAEMVIEEATKRLSPCWDLNAESFDIFKQYCEAIDSLVKEGDAEALTVSVDELKMRVAVTLSCNGLVFKEDNILMQLTKRAINVQVAPDNDMLEVTFIFPSLWERASYLIYTEEVQ